MNARAKSLANLRIVSFGTFVAGNSCQLYLAELGADVVKVEAHRHPEELRMYYSPEHQRLYEPSGIQTTALFSSLARSVRSLCLEMNNPEAPALFEQLVAIADVVVENFGPGVLESWGYDFDALLKINPKLVLVSISGYGRTGPRVHYRAFGSNITNVVGLADAWRANGTHFDYVAAAHAALGTLAGVMEVKRTGKGVVVDISQVESAATIMAPLYLAQLADGVAWSAGPNEVPGALLSEVFRCLGFDRWLAVELRDTDEWAATCRLLERDELVDLSGDERGRKGLSESLKNWAAQLSPHQAASRLQRIGVAAAAVQDGEDLIRDPQLRARGYIQEIDQPEVGPCEYPGSPHRMSKTGGAIRRPAPRLGQHTVEILRDWLAMPDDDIATLAATGVLGPHEFVHLMIDTQLQEPEHE